MNLVILHHHLNPGGVTRVVENHLLALAANSPEEQPERALILHGGRADGWPQDTIASALPFPLDISIVEGLDYDLTGVQASSDLGRRIAAKLSAAGLAPEETLLHWHNHSLGKNASAPLAVSHLAEQGYRILLQVHDFAEDFRPSNYRYLLRKLAGTDSERLPELLYPQAAGIHYAVLNGRDRAVFAEAGVDAPRLHFLPNPVAAPPIDENAAASRQLVNEKLGIPAEHQLIVYPVRGIRRKNLGEVLLWATLCPDASFLVTLAPQNPKERASFDRWAKLAEELQLPCQFGVPQSAEISFGQLLAASDALLTTSVAEGFGMTFLECWLAGRNLLGRDLPEISADYKTVGLELSQLYDALLIPTDWLDRGQFLSELSTLLAETYSGFGVAPITPKELQQQLAGLFDQPTMDEPTIDFARLPTALQASVVRKAHDEPASQEKLRKLNPKLAVPSQPHEDQVANNAAVTKKEFSLAKLGKQLHTTYDVVLNSPPNSPVTPLPNGAAILATFLRTERLNLVRVES